ncbi:uncharacterized protein LOC119165656 isoform X2 [Rhipicephalus microplus]|uniref:uncharacterized protein LOC119165656 isoform X2 n=1 Tax=Rhipicephalus microplus TaxID=6941 RepID=UPI003F6D93EF
MVWKWDAQRTAFLVLFLEICMVDHGTPCNTQLPRMGPRLFHAKALFGDIMRACKKELVAYAKTIPSDKMATVLKLGCSIYNACKSLIQKDTLRQSSPHYTRLNLTKAHREVAANALACAWDVVAAHPSNIEALDDAAALTRRVVLTFGWT